MTTDVATRKDSPLATVQRYFEQHKAQIAAALPKHLTPDRMARLALTSISQSRKLAECEARSIFGSVIVASQLGLEIGVGGQGYLVPYKGKATFVPGWQGIVDLVSRAGRATVWTGAVFEGDEFDWQLGDRPYVKHRPCGESDPKLLTHVYAVGRVMGAEQAVIECWPIARVWKHRDKYNKVGSDHYSFAHPEMYGRKVVLLQVMKYMPKSIEITAAVELSHRVDQGTHATLDGNFMVLGDEEPAGEPGPTLTEQVQRKHKAGPAVVDAEIVEQAQQQEPEPMDTAALLAAVAAATTVEELDLLRSRADEAPKKDHAKITGAIAERMKAMAPA